MNTFCKLIVSAVLSAKVSAAEAYQADPVNVSRVGTNVKFVYQINAQGSHTPEKALGFAKTTSEEPTELNYVTPLGIRQQYMIGNELRFRYVEDMQGAFLAPKYDITQTFIQTSWNDTAILSSQAMMLGLFPPGENNYVLEEAQKYNAVPPIENFDFKPWIDEMGLEALPHQTTIFPIQMNGWSYDYMLALDDTNCPARMTARQAKVQEMKTIAKDIATSLYPTSKLSAFFDQYGGAGQVCDYVNWAYTESVDLNDAFNTATGADLDSTWIACNAIGKNFTQTFYDIDNSLNGISTNDVRFNMQKRMVQWLGQDTSKTYDPKYKITEQLAEIKSKKWLTTTAGTESPSYIMFHTNEELLSLIAQSLSGDTKLVSQLPLTPSSTIVVEITQPVAAGDLVVNAWVNDQQVTLKGCADAITCNVTDFQLALSKAITITDVAAACKA